MIRIQILWIAGTLAICCGLARTKAAPFDIDYRALVSRADLTYSTPVDRSEEGMPVGNGRMGSLVWTTPSALRFQINRVDVFAEDSTTVSFPQADTDYAGGCGNMDINLVDSGEDVFCGNDFRQHLSVYEGLMTAQGRGLTARVLAWPQHDVMAVEIEDHRRRRAAINIDLRMLRFAIQRVSGRNYELATNHAVMLQTGEHTATSKLDIRDGRILLLQEFRENEFYDASAVAISVAGCKAPARYLNETTVQLSVSPGKGRFAILIASAANFDRQKEVGALALAELAAAEARGFSRLQTDTAAWWHDFWSRGFVSMHSADGQADFVEQNYTYYLYLMGASSRGKYPPRFGGMLWRTTGDLSRWGSQYWWANTRAYYDNLMPANRLDLMAPLFSLYNGMYDACALAAQQQWGSKGIWIPETTFFNGPEKLPDDIATELRDLMLMRKPFEERSAKFQALAEVKNRHNSRWNFQADGRWEQGHYVSRNKGHGIFGHTTHILGPSARIANLAWQRYQFTMDTNWLREQAYPLIKGSTEFYRSFPNLKKGQDGKYHIYHVNNSESDWGSSDTRYEVSCMHLIFPLAMRASEILGLDADLRPLWREISENLVPLPDGGDRRRSGGAYGAFVYGGPGEIEPIGPEPELKRRFLGFNRLGSFIDSRGTGGAKIFRNRLRLREGPGAIDAEHLGGLVSGIHSTLLSSEPDSPGGEPVLKLFTGWPRDWDAAFMLRARGAFVVTSSYRQGRLEFVEVVSQAGEECHLQNPWGDCEVSLCRDGQQAEAVKGSRLSFETRRGETIVLNRNKQPGHKP